MEKFALTAVANAQLQIAGDAPSGRSSITLHGGHDHALRQTLIALLDGQEMELHNGPVEATLLVLTGVVDVTTQDESFQVASGDLLVLPAEPHTIVARDDVTALLTVSKGDYPD